MQSLQKWFTDKGVALAGAIVLLAVLFFDWIKLSAEGLDALGFNIFSISRVVENVPNKGLSYSGFSGLIFALVVFLLIIAAVFLVVSMIGAKRSNSAGFAFVGFSFSAIASLGFIGFFALINSQVSAIGLGFPAYVLCAASIAGIILSLIKLRALTGGEDIFAFRKEQYPRLKDKTVPSYMLDNALYIIMFIAVVYISLVNPLFLTAPSIVNVLRLTAANIPAALGIAGCIVLTGTDLSAGRIVGLTACVGASLLQASDAANKMWPDIGTLPIPLVILFVVAIGAALGSFNGLFVAKFKLHPFIVTLGTQLIVYSMILMYVKMGNNNGMAIASLDKSYTDFIMGSHVWDFLVRDILRITTDIAIPNFVWFSIVLVGIMWFVWNKTTLGKNMFALGSNEEAARVSGVNVLATTIAVFALAGAMYSMTGFIEGARIGSNQPNTGFSYELDAIAACVIGGVSFVGGIGKIRGILLGVFLLRLIFVGLNAISVDQNLQFAIKGAIILFACAVDMRKYLVKR